MTESTETKLARFGDSIYQIRSDIKEIKESQKETNQKLDGEFATKQYVETQIELLQLKQAPFNKSVAALMGICGVETAGLLFFLVKEFIVKK